ncbi:MAG: 7-carboxy-7-deazaguanine synthase QueE, partial [Bacteroidetes bacterium]
VEWSKRVQLSDAITEYIKKHPQWQLSMQVHKYLNIP